jgi:hypothetical protein
MYVFSFFTIPQVQLIMEQYPIPAIHTFPNTPLVLCPTPSSELDRRGGSEESHLLGCISFANNCSLVRTGKAISRSPFGFGGDKFLDRWHFNYANSFPVAFLRCAEICL